MRTDVRELSMNEIKIEAGSPFDGPAVDVLLEMDDKILDEENEFDYKNSDDLEDDDFDEEDIDIEEIEDDELIDDDDHDNNDDDGDDGDDGDDEDDF